MKIKFLEGIYQGKEFEFNSPAVTIGRDGGNQLILDTDGVSRCHAELKQMTDGRWEIHDLNSTNGVKINSVRISGSAPVNNGDLLGIGENTLLVTALNPEPSRVIFNPIVSTQETSVPPPSPAPSEAVKPLLAVAEEEKKPEPPPAPEKEGPSRPGSSENAAEQISMELRQFSGSLFGAKGAAKGKKDSENSAAANPAEEKKKRRSNLIFYTVLVCVVIMILSSAFSIMSPKAEKSTVRRSESPIVVRYEKEIITRDNVFRFDFHLKSAIVTVPASGEKQESGKKSAPVRRREYTVTFTIDDIASRRHFSRETPVSIETVNEMREKIRSSGILTADNTSQGRDDSINRLLTLVVGNKVLQMAVPGKYASTEFNAVEDAISELTESFNLKTISMTPQELIELAEKSFLKAEDLYGNRYAAATNLREAIKLYQTVVESLEQFSPKPPRWDQARRKLAEAIKARDLSLNALETEYKSLAQMRDLSKMSHVFRQMMDLTDPESREHARAKRRMLIIEQNLRKKKR